MHVSLSLEGATGAWPIIENVGKDAPAVAAELVAAIKATAKNIMAISAADMAAAKSYVAKVRAAQ